MKLYQTKPLNESINVSIIDPVALESRACDGLLKLSLDLGLLVFRQMMNDEATEIAGPKRKHSTNRTAYWHGTEKTQIVLGGSKIRTTRVRVRGIDGNEKPLKTLELFQNEDPLNEALLSRLLSGVSTRKYERTLDTGSDNSKCTSKSEASRRFKAGMKALMEEFFERTIDASYPAIIVDGTQIGKMTVVAAMGIDKDGRKRVLGIREGSTENTEVVTALFNDLVERGLSESEPRLYVIDGGKALHKAVTDRFGSMALIQRCQVHKKRNVLSHLPQSEQGNISIAMTNAYKEFDYNEAKSRLMRIHRNIEHRYPKAAASLLEGLEETLTVHRLKVPGLLRLTLSSTNAMESANSVCKGIIKRVRRYRNGEEVIRHAAAGFMEAEKGFRRVKGYKQIPFLQCALAKNTGQEKSTILESIA